METKVNISDDLANDLKKAISELGLDESSEFIENAIREKLLDLKKKRFFEISDEVSNGLNKNKVDADQLLEEFNNKK